MRTAALFLVAILSAAVLLGGCPPPGAGPTSPVGGAGSPTDGGRDAPGP
jgi:hypothetical protein